MVCPQCQDRGIIILDNETALPCSCIKQKSVVRKFKSAKLPKDMLNATFDQFKFDYYSPKSMVEHRSHYQLAKDAYEAAREFVGNFMEDSETDGLYITGPVGSGKTFLVSCIANALLEMGTEVLFLIVPDLLDEIKATYDTLTHSAHSEQDLLDTARRVKLLILDDLGAHNYTEWVRNKIYSIINYRINNQLPTIITSNISLEDLDSFLGERTTSRIFQMCKGYILTVDNDIRYIKRTEKKNCLG